MTETLSLPDIEALACDCLTRAGVAVDTARTVAAEVAAAEAAGERAHGLEALLRDLRAIRYGQLLPAALPQIRRQSPAILALDAAHGFATAALMGALAELADTARQQGLALVRLERASHAGAMILPVTCLAESGYVALGVTPDGAARFAHPFGHGALRLPETTPRPPIMALFGLADQAHVETPLDGPVNATAWLLAADPDAMGAAAFAPELKQRAPAPASEVALGADLLEQIVTA